MSIRERPTKADLGYVPVGSAIWFLSADASRHGTRHKRTEDAVPATGKAFVGGISDFGGKADKCGSRADVEPHTTCRSGWDGSAS